MDVPTDMNIYALLITTKNDSILDFSPVEWAATLAEKQKCNSHTIVFGELSQKDVDKKDELQYLPVYMTPFLGKATADAQSGATDFLPTSQAMLFAAIQDLPHGRGAHG